MAKQIILSTPLEYHPGAAYVYSDLGADILGMVVEAVSGERLDHFLAERVFQPLGMEHTFFCPDDSLRRRSLFTRNRPATRLSAPRRSPRRKRLRHGRHCRARRTVQHRLRSRHLRPNAAEPRRVQRRSYIVSDSTVRLFTKRRRRPSRARLGYTQPASTVQAAISATRRVRRTRDSPGTSIWIDPDREMFVILLTNSSPSPKIPAPTA